MLELKQDSMPVFILEGETEMVMSRRRLETAGIWPQAKSCLLPPGAGRGWGGGNLDLHLYVS